MQYKEEKFSFLDKEYVRMFQSDKRQETLHCHNCLELNLVEKGSGTYIIGGKLYEMEPGDIFVINNSEHHLALHNSEDLTLTVLVLESGHLWRSPSGVDYLKPFLGRSESFSNRITSAEEDYVQMKQVFEWLKQELLLEIDVSDENVDNIWEKEDMLVVEATVKLLLSLLYRYYEKKEELAGGKPNSTDYLFGPIGKVFSYINEHFAEKITLEELAKESSLSRTYLSRYFKELTGQTLFSYIQQTRLQYASYLLQTSKKTITEIAVESGFGNLSYFNRVFKKTYGRAPGKFR